MLAKGHFKGYRIEALPVKNVTVTGCTFENVPRGIGSHTAICNAPFSNITIKNCTFKDKKSCPIEGCYWKNVTITGNKVSGSPRGITMFSVNCVGGLISRTSYGTFPASYFDKLGGVKSGISNSYKNPGNMNIKITNNIITLNNTKDPYAGYERIGILVYGTRVKSTKKYYDGSGKIPKGKYYMNGITISGNTITTGGHGIRLVATKNCTIKNNEIHKTKNAKKTRGTRYGIHVTHNSTKDKVIGNTIYKGFQKSIAATLGSKLSTKSGNKIKKSQ